MKRDRVEQDATFDDTPRYEEEVTTVGLGLSVRRTLVLVDGSSEKLRTLVSGKQYRLYCSCNLGKGVS